MQLVLLIIDYINMFLLSLKYVLFLRLVTLQKTLEYLAVRLLLLQIPAGIKLRQL